ncbi:MAG TPA: glycosyltransferase [Jatrophihabitans sp.]|jgi:UDP:flavonoid glycosyltransferase YjiC (YdhE family)|nr:glycosyltransferase [Jatrophihabitans sp.]
MRVLIVTAGSRGDVAPYTGLGQRLKQAGHEVAVAAHELFAGLVRNCDLEYRALPGDPVALARARTSAQSPDEVRSIFATFLVGLGEGLIAATTAGADVLVTAFGPAPLSRVVAEGFGIPSIGAYLLPGVPTAAFPLPGWPGRGDLGAAGNRAAGREMLERAGALYGEIVPGLRARLGLPADTTTPTVDASPPRGWPICHGFSPTVLPRPDDWPAEVRVTGYWWPATPTGWEPPGELLDFIQADAPPVFIGFGSMAPGEGEPLTDVVAAAIKRAGVRAVVQAGWADLKPVGDDILLVGDVPHDWLFPRMAAVVHHAGAGTTGAGLRAGVPAVAVPVVLDQPFWAARLHHLGAGPSPLPQREATAGALADAIRACLDEPAYRTRAVELARRISAEDGCAPVVELIAGL